MNTEEAQGKPQPRFTYSRRHGTQN